MRRGGATSSSTSADISGTAGPTDAEAATETTTTTLEELPSGELVPTSALPSLDTTPSSSRPSTPSHPTPDSVAPAPASTPSPASLAVQRGESLTPLRFELLKLGVDRRLLLNRKRQLKMFRVWMQGRWRKPVEAPAADEGEEVRARGEAEQ